MASLNIAGVRKPAAKGHGGAHVAHHKNTSAMPVERMPVPASVTIPLSQHIGAPNEAQVKVGDVVKVWVVEVDEKKKRIALTMVKNKV